MSEWLLQLGLADAGPAIRMVRGPLTAAGPVQTFALASPGFRMTFLYKSEPVRGAIWQRMFTEQLPDLPFCVWPDTGDKDAVATSAPGRSPTTIVEAGDAQFSS